MAPAPNMLERPERTHRSSTWAQMTARERLHCYYQMLDAGWDLDLTRHAVYDMDCDLTLVEFRAGDSRSAAAYGTVKWEPAETLRRIEERFGPEARRRVEEVIGS